MSIYDFVNKIKGKLDIDNYTLVCLFIIILVSIGSFGLGRLSVLNDYKNNLGKDDLSSSVAGVIKDDINNSQNISSSDTKKKMYVASKNGKLYYSAGCSGANRIKSENQVWFATSSDAEKSGYTLATSCK